MKKCLPLLLVLFSAALHGQTIAPAPSGKAVVYIVRPSALGFAINFSYFDSTKLIGRFNGGKYIRYECEPGTHLFWARSENRDFIRGEVEAGKIYFLQAIPRMGAIKAGVNFVQVDPNNPKEMKSILKLLSKKPSETFSEQQLSSDTKDLQDAIDRGIEKYSADKAKGKAAASLDKSKYMQSTN